MSSGNEAKPSSNPILTKSAQIFCHSLTRTGEVQCSVLGKPGFYNKKTKSSGGQPALLKMPVWQYLRLAKHNERQASHDDDGYDDYFRYV